MGLCGARLLIQMRPVYDISGLMTCKIRVSSLSTVIQNIHFEISDQDVAACDKFGKLVAHWKRLGTPAYDYVLYVHTL